MSDVAHTEANIIWRWTGSLPDTFNQLTTATIISNRNGVASNATKPRNSLSGSDGLGRLAFALEISSASIGAAT